MACYDDGLRLVLHIGVIPCTLWACGRYGFDDTLLSDADSDGIDATRDARPPPPMLSCIGGLAATCGSNGTDSCCDSPPVPAGSFYVHYDVGTDGAYTNMTNLATVSAFRLDRHEVTVGRFREFVNAGMGTQQNPPTAGAGARTLNGLADQAGWDPAWNALLPADTAALITALQCPSGPTWQSTPGPGDGFAMNCMSWYEAFAFCVWDGGFMPTEIELKYAAAGGDEHRAYPWSVPASNVTINCTRANLFIGGTNCYFYIDRAGQRSPDGDGRWGHADLSGNVFDWALDWAGGTWPSPCIDCALLTPTANKFLAGGSVTQASTYNRVGYANARPPDQGVIDRGVRCARVPL